MINQTENVKEIQAEARKLAKRVWKERRQLALICLSESMDRTDIAVAYGKVIEHTTKYHEFVDSHVHVVFEDHLRTAH